MSELKFNVLSAEDVRALIEKRDETEVAVIDIRPTGTFGDAHLLWANSVPLSTLELEIGSRAKAQYARCALCG